MFISSDEKCPVCNKQFNDGDDIVICPHCGTPHHRECYNAVGHCINADKHSTDFEYGASESTDAPQVQESAETGSEQSGEQYYQPQEQQAQPYGKAQGKTVCSSCGEEIENDAPFCSKCGAEQENPQYREYSPADSFGLSGAEQRKYENESRTIDGKSVSDLAAVVRTNTSRFIPKFIENKKTSWNWSAFIFGPYYLFFRKMYKQGILFTAVNLALTLVLNALYAEEIYAYTAFLNANSSVLFSNPSQELIAQMNEVAQPLVPMMIISVAAALIIRVIIALFADTFYRAKTIGVLDKVEKNLSDGASFNMTMPMMEEQSLSQADMKKIYLGKMGGTSFFAPVIAYFALELITSIISKL